MEGKESENKNKQDQGCHFTALFAIANSNYNYCVLILQKWFVPLECVIRVD